MSALYEFLSFDTVRQLAERFGGGRLYVPQTPTVAMIEAIGSEAASTLCDKYSGERLEIPTTASVDYTVAKAKAKELLRQSSPPSMTYIAAKTGLSRRSVSRLRDRLK